MLTGAMLKLEFNLTDQFLVKKSRQAQHLEGRKGGLSSVGGSI